MSQEETGIPQVKDGYDEIFAIEMDGWCYGIQNYPGEIFPGLIHAVVKEISPGFRMALQHHYAFNVMELSSKLSKAAKFLVHEKEIAFSIMAQLPNPSELNEDEQFILAQVIDPVEVAYGGVIERLQRKWNFEKRRKAA
ncbi:MAG: hypothetical protein KDD42_02660 [Bdellovibrionales bacterium]|nr:hypothetical protein [Bdellovibrionales bacterium]